ncbi:MAG: response regulator [Acidobacteria bacterium]|nr:response regulator [Acidobacteriota bacterium]
MSAKILVVEDNPQNRLLVADLLRWHGYEVLEARDGEEGIRLAREHLPNLILMDIQMPLLSGLEAARTLRSDPLTAHIKIVAVTSMAMKGDREKIVEVGLDDYIPKPVDTRRLPVLIREVLER